MLLKFLPNAKCLIDRFLLSQTTSVERSDSRPVKNQIRLRIKTHFHKRPRQGPIINAIFIQLTVSVYKFPRALEKFPIFYYKIFFSFLPLFFNKNKCFLQTPLNLHLNQPFKSPS